MKNFLFSIIALVALFFVASCEKKRCYNCVTTVVTYTDTTFTSSTNSVKAHCNATEDDIAEVEEKGTSQTSRMVDGKLVTVRTTTTCDY